MFIGLSPLLNDRMTGEYSMRQAAIRPLVHSSGLNDLIGSGLAELGASQVRARFRGLALAVQSRAHIPARLLLTQPVPLQPLESVWEQRCKGCYCGPDGKQDGCPARQDAGAERGDAKQHAAEHIQDP